MERFFNGLRLGPFSDDTPTAISVAEGKQKSGEPGLSGLETLPSELIFQILTYLSPTCLAVVLTVSGRLRFHAQNDLLWEELVRQNIPPETPVWSPAPAKTWQELYICHHPYWFLVRHGIWHSDRNAKGDVVVIRFDARRGSIIGHRVRGLNSLRTAQQWSYDPNVFLMHFRPVVYLRQDEPVINLKFEEGRRGHPVPQEVAMSISGQGIYWLLSLCQRLPDKIPYENMALWPPLTIPSRDRVRNESPSMFRSNGQRPCSLAAASDQAFRLRRGTMLRVAETVSTWSNLDPDLYTPSKHKPWQGIWIGDYSTHGCELLLVIQRLSRRSRTLTTVPESESALPAGFSIEDSEVADDSDADIEREDYSVSGSLEAIKLTGDINVPRGQLTWIADDISDSGLIRIADDDAFRGGRIVRAMGHVADRGFQNDRFIPSQLILKDLSNIAQYWEAFGHASQFRRVDIVSLLQNELE